MKEIFAVAPSVASSVQTHPDYKIFRGLDSPLNFLSRDINSGDFFQKKNLSRHYSESQTAFANHSMSGLIELVRKFNPAEIFTNEVSTIGGSSKDVVYLGEMQVMEDFYKEVTQRRVYIDENTQSSREKLLARQRVAEKISQSQKIAEEDKILATSIERLLYVPSDKHKSTYTNLSAAGSKYSKYVNSNKKLFGYLPLSYFSKLLGVANPKDESIVVGYIETYRGDADLNMRSGDVIHEMGDYSMVQEDVSKSMVRRVDYVTALAAKKALQTTDEEEALKLHSFLGLCAVTI